MANKEFKIQSDTVSLNGVPLSSSADGKVVIPGVTRASGYIVEETDKYSDDNNVYSSGTVTAIDQYTYLAWLGQQTPPQGWIPATYTVTLDDENKIDEIVATSAGANYPVESSAINSDNMMISPSGVEPLESNVVGGINDWVPTTYFVKMKANGIESEFGGGGGAVVAREIVFPQGESGDTQGTIALNSAGDTYICTADYVAVELLEGDTDIETNIAFNVGQTGGLFLQWTTNISNYSDIQALFVADGWNGSSVNYGFSIPSGFTIVSEAFQNYPTPHTCTTVGINSNGDLYFLVPYAIGDASDIAQGASATVAWSVSFNQPAIWKQLNGSNSNTGDIVFNGSDIDSDTSGNFVNLDVSGEGRMRLGTMNNDTLQLITNWDGDTKIWEFGTDGSLTFPDGTTQTTAYTGQSGGSTASRTYYVMANSSGEVLTSTDGVTWSAPVDITNNGINHVATNGVNIVYVDGDTIGYTSFANPGTATELTPSPVPSGTGPVNFSQIIYGGGYFVVAGQCPAGSNNIPVYGYSSDGINWTVKTITDSSLQLALANNNSENCQFSDIDYNGVGFNFAVSGTHVGGGVYTTDITETFTLTNYFSMVPGVQVAWNGNTWFYFNTGEGSGVNSNIDPRVGSWNGPIDPWSTRIADLGYVGTPDISDTMSGGDGVLALSDGEGHVTYSTDNGVSWTIVTPIPYSNSISDIVRGTTTTISWSGTSHGFTNGEKIVISGAQSFDAGEPGTSNQSYNGTFYIKDGLTPELYTDQGLTTPWDTSTYWPPGTGPGSMTGTITFSHGTYIDAMDYANGYFYIGNDDEKVARASTADMTTWTILDDQNNAFEYWNDFYGYTVPGTNIASELVGDGAVASSGYKTTVYTNWQGYQGGEAGGDWFAYTADIAVGDTLTFRNGEVRTVTQVNQSPGDHTAVAWNGSVDGADYNPRYPITVTSANYVEAVKNTARIKPDSDAAVDHEQYMDIYAGIVPPVVVNTPIDNKHIHMAGHTGDVELFLGTDNNYVSVKEAGVAPASVNLHSENDVSVVDSNLRLNRKGSSWASIYGDGENRNLHNNTYDVSWSTIAVDDQGDYYVGGESDAYAEAIVSKISRDGQLLWSKYVNGNNTAGWQFDGVAYHNNEVATLVQTDYNRNRNYYKLTVHDSESGDVKSTTDIYDPDGRIDARHMIHHSTLGWVMVGKTYGEASNTMAISSIGATGTGIIELPGSQSKIGGLYPESYSGWTVSGTNITGFQDLQLGLGLYQAVPLTTVTGIGSGGAISLIANYNYGNYGWDQWTSTGQDYQTGDQVKALGSLLGGVDGGSSFIVTGVASTPGTQIKLYFDKTANPDLYSQLTNATYQAVYDTNYYNIVSVTDQGSNWEVTLDTNILPSGATITFYTQYGNDAYFTVYGWNGFLDGINGALNGVPSNKTIRIDMGRYMGYGSTDFTGGSFTLSKTLNAQAVVWTSSGLKKYLPSAQTNGSSYAQCVAEDTYDGGLVIGGYTDNNNHGSSFVWKLLADGTTSWAKTINSDNSAMLHIAVSAVNGDVFASNGYSSINKFTSSGSFVDRYETNGSWGLDAHVYIAVEDGVEYLYVGGSGGAMWTSNSGLMLSKLTTDFKVIWGRSVCHSNQGLNTNYDYNHVTFVLGKGQATVVGYSHVNGWNYANGTILTLPTKDEFQSRDVGHWSLLQSGSMKWVNFMGPYSEYDLISNGVTPTTSSVITELDTDNLDWTNYTFQYKLIDLNPTKQGIRGVVAIEFADGGVLEHNPAIIPPSVHFDSNYSWYYTLQLTDMGRCIINQTVPNDSYCQNLYITVPRNDNVAFPVGTVITLVNTSSSDAGGYSIYVRPEDYSNSECPKIWATGYQNYSTWSFQGIQTATLMKISTNAWLLTANDIVNRD